MLQNVQPIDLTMGWSHDIRTHLYIIKGAVGMIQSGKLTQEQTGEYTEMIRQNVSAMEKLMNHLLNGVHKDHMDQGPEWIETETLLRQVVENVKPYAASLHVDLVYDIESGIRICCDAEMLERVLYNLITNALKSTEAGGVVYLRSTKSKTGVRMTISDTGCGLSKEQLDQLRGGPDQAVGEGVGLRLVKSLIEAMNGQMECNSQLDVGTTFYFELPENKRIQAHCPSESMALKTSARAAMPHD